MTPTEVEIKRFWEACGFRLLSGGEWCEAPDRPGYARKLPPIDPNFLFRYAVPKLKEKLQYEENAYRFWGAMNDWLQDWVLKKKDPADSLFELCYKIFGLEE